jgi:hypothetical protein
LKLNFSYVAFINFKFHSEFSTQCTPNIVPMFYFTKKIRLNKWIFSTLEFLATSFLLLFF